MCRVRRSLSQVKENSLKRFLAINYKGKITKSEWWIQGVGGSVAIFMVYFVFFFLVGFITAALGLASTAWDLGTYKGLWILDIILYSYLFARVLGYWKRAYQGGSECAS